MKNFFLYPGQLLSVRETSTLATMLGSCVGVALWDPKTKVGGLNHYLLPAPGAHDRPSPRYGTFAMQTLIDECLALGAQPRDLVAKVYGGAAVLGQVSIGQRIGEKNIEVALHALAKAGIKITEKNVGGERGRKIHFDTSTGAVQHALVGESGARVDTSGFGALQEAKEVKVLIVDDSATVRTLFQKIFEKHGLKVVGAAANAFEAREMIVNAKPDVITLDIEMPQMNGVRFLEKLMKHMPIPTVMVSSLGSQGDAALESLRLGAIEFVQKPSQSDPELLRQLGQTLVTKVRAAASSRLIAPRTSAPAVEARPRSSIMRGQVAGVFVSGNTGAPKSLVKMISKFTGDSPPVVFSIATLGPLLDSFVGDLKKQTSISVRVASESTLLARGCAYFIPEGYHGRVQASGTQVSLKLEKGAPVHGQLPSGDVLLSSAADSLGPSAVGVLLSGFGRDGVDGLEKIHAKGGFTMVENPSGATFPFVPQTAIAEGLASEILSSDEMFSALMSYRDRKSA